MLTTTWLAARCRATKSTKTKDKDYDLIWFVEASLDNALRLETYIQDAEQAGGSELAKLFRKAQADSRKGGEMGKQLLSSRLARQSQGGSPSQGGPPSRAEPQTQAIQEQIPGV